MDKNGRVTPLLQMEVIRKITKWFMEIMSPNKLFGPVGDFVHFVREVSQEVERIVGMRRAAPPRRASASPRRGT